MYRKNYNIVVHIIRDSPRTLITLNILQCYNTPKTPLHINYRLISNNYTAVDK